MPTRFSNTFISLGTPMRTERLLPEMSVIPAPHWGKKLIISLLPYLSRWAYAPARPLETPMGHAEHKLHDQSQPRTISLDEYWLPFTPNREFKSAPMLVVRAEGMYYWDDRGEKLIDAASGMFCCAAGHGRKEIAEAVHKQLQELDFISPSL